MHPISSSCFYMIQLLAIMFALCAVITPAHADVGVWITGGGVSKHFRNDNTLNERNNGFGVEVHTTSAVAFSAGTYTNSVSLKTKYAGVMWQPLSYGATKAGGVVIIMDGYPAFNEGGVFPVVLPMISVEYERVGVNLIIIPNFRDSPGAYVLQFKMKFN